MTRTAPRLLIPLAACGVAVLLAGCAGSGGSHGTASIPSSMSTPATAPASLARASVGSLTITGAYVPTPASPDVAAAYLTITNSGSVADRLTKVTSNVASMVMPMTETDSGGVGSMTNLSNITIPPHGSMQFVPDHAHLMLEKPTTLHAGNTVTLTLTFAHAGTVSITVPVLPLGQTPAPPPASMSMRPTSGAPSPAVMPSMSGMTSMGG